MSQHVHFDLVALRTSYEAANAKALAAARSKAKSPEAMRGIDLHEKLISIMIDAAVILAGARNEGVPEGTIAKAYGAVLGNMAGNYMRSMLDHGMTMHGLMLSERLHQLIEACISGEAPAGMVSASAETHSMQGGRA